MSHAFIANELKIRLLEHAPHALLSAKKLELSCAEIQIHYQPAEFDCVIAPLVLISQEAFFIFFKEVHRILAPNGIFLFSTLGNNTPHELEQIGDALLKTGFQLPVVDRETLGLQYDDKAVLEKDLEQSGLNEKWVHVTTESSEDMLVTLNVIYGYALGATTQAPFSGKIEIPIDTIKIRKIG